MLSDLSLVFPAGWTAVLGANGAGKSTLLRLVAGELAPVRGRLRVDGPLWLCPQSVEERPPGIAAWAGGADPEACRWRGRLALDPAQLVRWPTLSPGERKRWQVGMALAARPAVLLLDEPTNHLDGPGQALLLDALRAFPGVGLLVSHDRAFLDALAERSVLLEGGRAQAVALPPSQALAWLAQEQRSAVEALDLARARERSARASADRARRAHAAAGLQSSTARRMKGPRDHDGRSAGAKFRVARGERRRARDAGQASARVERAEAETEALARPTGLGASVFLQYAPSPRSTLLRLQAPALQVGGRRLLRDLDLCLGRGDRVHLSGPNGAGKTCLLQALLAACTLPAERVFALPQELSGAEALAWLDRLRALPAQTRGRVLQVVAALGVEPARLLATAQPSPGEARKLAIAMGLGAHAWLVVLDEPTHHLDLPSIERLEAALVAYPGALLLVSHDARLARACCRSRWSLQQGRVWEEGLDPAPLSP